MGLTTLPFLCPALRPNGHRDWFGQGIRTTDCKLAGYAAAQPRPDLPDEFPNGETLSRRTVYDRGERSQIIGQLSGFSGGHVQRN
jgi:hypothetical protein